MNSAVRVDAGPGSAAGAEVAPGREFASRYNRTPFVFAHALCEETAFDAAQLVELSKRLPDAYFSTKPATVGDGWGNGAATPRTLQDTLAHMDSTDSLVLLKGLAQDPQYAPIFRRLLAWVTERVGPALADDISIARATLVVSSPHRVTPYHIDAETNFLFQIRGEKQVSVFEPQDRSLLTHAELERFYGGDASAATYKPARQEEAFGFLLGPGMGLHIPLHAPHWVRNGDSVSVALSINCSLRSNARLSTLYNVNAFLRARGLSPARPGVSPWRDRLKVVFGYGLDSARRLRGRRRPTSVN